MKHSIDHNLEPKKAKHTLDQLLEAYCEHYKENSVETQWVSEDKAQIRFRATGKTVEGVVTVCDDCYDIDISLPMRFRPFKKRIRKTLDSEVARWVENAAS